MPGRERKREPGGRCRVDRWVSAGGFAWPIKNMHKVRLEVDDIGVVAEARRDERSGVIRKRQRTQNHRTEEKDKPQNQTREK
jgi:hypothetical protein